MNEPKKPFEPVEQPEQKPIVKTVNLPSAYTNALTLDEKAVEMWMANGSQRESVDAVVVESVPAKPGVLCSRINVAMRKNGTVFVKPELVARFIGGLSAYGFRRVDVQNKEGLQAFKK